MSYIEKKGNIFNSKAMAIVNTVNCVGAMGKGVALDFKLRFPEMFKEYQKICFKHILKPGQILPYHKSDPIILNFAIKDDWKDPSKVEWVEGTLEKFANNYKRMGITSVAFPWMGAMNGGIPIDIIKSLMRKYLSNLKDIDVEVYEFDPKQPCALFNTLRNIVDEGKLNVSQLSEMSNIQQRFWIKIIQSVEDGDTTSIYDVCKYEIEGKKIIGKTNITRLFSFLTKYKEGKILPSESLF